MGKSICLCVITCFILFGMITSSKDFMRKDALHSLYQAQGKAETEKMVLLYHLLLDTCTSHKQALLLCSKECLDPKRHTIPVQKGLTLLLNAGASYSQINLT